MPSRQSAAGEENGRKQTAVAALLMDDVSSKEVASDEKFKSSTTGWLPVGKVHKSK